MADEMIVETQRAPVIVAVILAAVTAAGLWYFFVFRQSTPAEFTTESPSAMAVASETPIPALGAVDTTAPSSVGGSTEWPVPVTSPFPTVIPEAIHTTAQTGPGEMMIVGAVATTMVGLLGLRQTRRRPTQPASF